MYHAYNSKLPHKLQSFLSQVEIARITALGKCISFIVCYKRTNMKAHCTMSIGTTLWNKLPNNISKNKNLFYI